jgi:hypothetical protein
MLFHIPYLAATFSLRVPDSQCREPAQLKHQTATGPRNIDLRWRIFIDRIREPAHVNTATLLLFQYVPRLYRFFRLVDISLSEQGRDRNFVSGGTNVSVQQCLKIQCLRGRGVRHMDIRAELVFPQGNNVSQLEFFGI